MKKFLMLLAPLALCACSADWSAGLEAARAARPGQPGQAEATAAQVPARVGTPRAAGFAAYPDKGDLVHYQAATPARRSGAYTSHAVDLSEAHAFNAIASGELSFPAPDGTPVKFAYERHVEHPDGNWSWIGTGADGQKAVITFGPDAAFGTIPMGADQPAMRLTYADGRAWVVTVDKRAFASIHNEATHPTSPDFLVPPKLAASTAVAGSHRMAGAPATAAAATSATTTIDVLVGYTGGYATSRGSQSAAVTRIRNMVDITNEAYATSQVNAEIRLVNTMQVSFADNTSNEDALEKLTGFKAPSTVTAPDPAFNALRQARETYGADLVALVRKFNDPENDGCGVAWLIGGGMAGIVQSDEYFGYSVISDGSDIGSDGKNYYCRDETFAHEIGHNLGAQHDIETSKDDNGDPQPGAYSYSYGYKTGSSAGNFYTIMAYGDTGQTGYPVFSNPNISTCGGRSCGASTADNARTINNTASIIAQFRAAIGPDASVRNDFNGDGRSDVFWRHAGNGTDAIWRSADSSQPQAATNVTDMGWSVAGTGDFNGDGVADVLWRHMGTGANTIWLAANHSTRQSVASLTDLRWKVAGIGDFDGDGRDDIVWWHSSTGLGTIWLAGNQSTRQSMTQITDTGWKIAAVGDFNADGRSDLVWKHDATGAGTIWFSANHSTRQNLTQVADLGWKIAGAGDFNGDGKSDLFWHHDYSGANTIWLAGNHATRQTVASIPDTRWRPVSIGDFDGNGEADVMFRHDTTGANTIWKSAMQSDRITVSSLTDKNWRVVSR